MDTTTKTTLAEEVRSLATNLIKAGVPARSVATELLSVGTGVLIGAVGTSATATLLRAAADGAEQTKQVRQ